MKLTTQQIKQYEKFSNAKIDVSKHRENYVYVIDKNNKGSWRLISSIIDFINYKTGNFNSNRNVPINHNKNYPINSNNKNVINIVKKDLSQQVSLSIASSVMSGIKALAKKNKVSLSYVVTQILKGYLNEQN